MYVCYILETCAAGSHSIGGFYCETCPVDTYKNKNDGSRCEPCRKGSTTGGKLGAIKCSCEYSDI